MFAGWASYQPQGRAQGRPFVAATLVLAGVLVGMPWGFFLAGGRATDAERCPHAARQPSIAAFATPLPGDASGYKGRHFSQAGQDALVDELLGNMTGGFFVESGAYDGVQLSNSLFFEASRGWTGLLVEANPSLYQSILARSNRTSARAIHACLSPTGVPAVLPFRVAGPLGGLTQHLSADHAARISREIGAAAPWMAGAAGTGRDVPVPCWPLEAMLAPLGVTRVDFWSLDTEGSEAAILASTDLERLDVRVLLVEVNDGAAEARVRAAMAAKPGYVLHARLDFDLLFVKAAALPLPRGRPHQA